MKSVASKLHALLLLFLCELHSRLMLLHVMVHAVNQLVFVVLPACRPEHAHYATFAFLCLDQIAEDSAGSLGYLA